MTSQVAEKAIIEELKEIKEELAYIKEHMVDVDTILSDEEKRLLDDSFKHEKDGTLISLEDLEHVRNKA